MHFLNSSTQPKDNSKFQKLPSSSLISDPHFCFMSLCCTPTSAEKTPSLGWREICELSFPREKSLSLLPKMGKQGGPEKVSWAKTTKGRTLADALVFQNY